MPYQKKPKKWTAEVDADLYKVGKSTAGFDLFANYPDENEDIVRRLKDHFDGDMPAVARRLLRMLRDEAKQILRQHKYPTDVGDLKCITPSSMEATAAHARTVLISAVRLEEDLANNDAARAMLDTLVLVASAIRSSSLDLTFRGLWNVQALAKSHTKGKHPGVLLAIADMRQKNPLLQGRRKPVWTHLKKLWREGHPWNHTTEDGAQYEITFEDRDTMVVATTKDGVAKRETLKERTVIEKYLATQ